MIKIVRDHAKFISSLEALSSEIRLQPCRYTGEGRWVCVTAMDEMDESFWMKFEDLTAGDNDYIRARDWLEDEANQKKGWFSIGYGEAPHIAMVNCLLKLDSMCQSNG